MQEPLRLPPDLPLADQLAAAFAAMMNEARRQARGAVDTPASAVHDYRRAVRRAQAVVSLTRPMMRKHGRRLLEGELARATRSTRTLRDLDAVMPMLGKLEGADLDAGDAVALGALRGYLEAAQAELAGSEISAWRLRKNVRALAGLEDIYRAALHAWVEPDMLLDALRDHYKDTRRAYRTAKSTLNVGDLHTWRKSARTLRYQLELLATTSAIDAGLPALHDTFVKQVKQLGAVTDLMALATIVADADAELLGTDPRALVDKLEALVDARATAAFLDAEVTFALKPRDFATPAPHEPAAEAAPAGGETPAPAPEAAPAPVASASD